MSMAERKCVTDAAPAPTPASVLASAPAQRLSNAWVVLFTLLAIYIFNFADRYLLTGLVGPIKAEFGLDDGFMGLLMGPAFVALYVVAGVPIAQMADRSSRIRIIAAGCVVWSACTIATGLATGPTSLALARVGVGIGEAAFVAPAFSLLSDYFRPERRPLAFAILALATYLGQIAGQGGGPAIAAAYDWRTAFFAMGAPGIALAFVALALVREPPRAHVATANAMPFRAVFKRVAGAPAYWLMMAGFTCGTLSGVSFGYWGPEMFTRLFAIDPVVAKSTFALNFGLAGLAGMLGFGALANHLARRDVNWPLRLAAFSMASATAMILAAAWIGDYALAMLLAIPCGLLGGGWSSGMMAVLQHLLPQAFRATATALFLAIVTLIGYSLGPWLAGAFSDALGGDAQALRLALTLIMPTGFVGAICAWAAVRRVEADRARLIEG